MPLVLAVLAVLLLAAPASADVRFATFNASLNRSAEGRLVQDLGDPSHPQLRGAAEVVQRVRPDVLLLNEVDFDPRVPDLLRRNFLEVGQGGAPPIRFPYAFVAPSNTGIASGLDLNGDGRVVTEPGSRGYGDDAFGFGEFPGQYGMLVLSRFPIGDVRTFARFRWADMPGNRIPDGFYSAEEREALRLSSKSHWDVPVRIGKRTVHLLASHPTPPTFDGPEDRNGRRNADEIRFWADYVTPNRSGYVVDDEGRRGGLSPSERFVVAGDQNADPADGDSFPGAIAQLLEHPRVDTRLTPSSIGAVEAAEQQGRANDRHRGDPAFDTADFADGAPGNLRVDYVLPRKGMRLSGGGVFWLTRASPLWSRLIGAFPFPVSDHRAVWIDVEP